MASREDSRKEEAPVKNIEAAINDFKIGMEKTIGHREKVASAITEEARKMKNPFAGLFDLMMEGNFNRGKDDVTVLEVIALLAGVVDRLLERVQRLEPTANLTLEHDKVYRELQEIIRKMKEEKKTDENEDLKKEKGFDLMLKRMVGRGVIG